MKMLNGFCEGVLVAVWADVDQATVSCEGVRDVWVRHKVEMPLCSLLIPGHSRYNR